MNQKKYISLSEDLQSRILEDRKNNWVNPYRCNDENVVRRDMGHDKANLWRPAFVRDCEKIMHNPFYNRYNDKTQVFSLYRNDDISRRSHHVQLVSRIARNIGNVLEVKEAMDFFDGKYDKRLYELSVYISSLMISSAKKISFTNAKKLVINLLESGHAKNKFYEWIKSQGGNIHKLKDKAKKVDIISTKTGYVNSIDSNLIAELVFNLGAGRVKKTDPVDYAVGVTLNKVIGDKVKEGEVLGTIYYNKKLDGMDKLFINSFKIEKKKKRVKKIIIKIIK